MATVERIVLPPSSHNNNQTRFTFPQSAELQSSSLMLELTDLGLTVDAQWYIPRAGGFALIQQIELLRNGESISYLNRADGWAAIKAMCIDSEASDVMENFTKGAHKIDVAAVGSQNGAVNGYGFDGHLIQYNRALRSPDAKTCGPPLLPLAHIMDIFHKNALIVAFVDNSTAANSYSSPSVVFGQCRSRVCSNGLYTMNLIINGDSLLARPLSQDSERLFELGLALDSISGLGTSNLSVPLNTGACTWLQYTRSHDLLTSSDQIGQICYYGFRLTQNGKPIYLNDLGMYLQINRSSTATAVPELTVYAWLF